MNEVCELRTAAGLTQAELARRSGVAQPNVAAYESGRRRPSAAMLARLRRAASPLPREALARRRDELVEVAARHVMRDVRVFGSVSRGTDTSVSDVDLLVDPPATAGLLELAAFALEVEDLLGFPVDLVTEGGLRPDHPIRAEAVPL